MKSIVPEVERRFVERYIIRQRRARLLYELAHDRERVYWRFSGPDWLVAETLHPLKPTSPEMIYREMLSLGADPGPAHVFGRDEEDLPLLQALQRRYLWGKFLLLAKDAKVVYYEAEPYPRSDKYLLF